MKAFRSIRMCLVAVLATGVIVAPSALAKKAVPITGPIKVTSTVGEAELKAASLGTVKCKHGADVGEITGPDTATDTVTFSECEGFGVKCKSSGEESGTIRTFVLDNEIGWVDKAKDEVGLDFKPGPENATYLAEFDCSAQKLKVRGSVIGTVGPLDQMGIETSEVFTGEGFAQAIQSFEGLPKDTLVTESSTNVGEFESLQLATGATLDEEVEVEGKHGAKEKLKNPAEISTTEVKCEEVEVPKGKKKVKEVQCAVVPRAQPIFGRCQPFKHGKYEDGNCTKVDAKKGKFKGKYEFEPV